MEATVTAIKLASGAQFESGASSHVLAWWLTVGQDGFPAPSARRIRSGELGRCGSDNVPDASRRRVGSEVASSGSHSGRDPPAGSR